MKKAGFLEKCKIFALSRWTKRQVFTAHCRPVHSSSETEEGRNGSQPLHCKSWLPLAHWCGRQAVSVVTASIIPSAISKEQHGKRTGTLSCPFLALAASKLVGCFPYTQQPRMTGTRSFYRRSSQLLGWAAAETLPSSLTQSAASQSLGDYTQSGSKVN